MSKRGGWDKKGSTWESLGKLKLTMGNMGWWSNTNAAWNETELPNANHKIIEIVIKETEDTMTDLQDMVVRQRRYIALGKRFGQAFRELVERIEAQNMAEQFQWVMVVDAGYDWNTRQQTGDIVSLLETCKLMKLKQNKDFKKASAFNERQAAVAFADKNVAMRVRLSMHGKVFGINIKDYVETDLDTKDDSALNSST